MRWRGRNFNYCRHSLKLRFLAGERPQSDDFPQDRRAEGDDHCGIRVAFRLE